MKDAGDSDSGDLGKEVPTEDKTVELRKSCDYCVRLKRACDGKNPCSLCARRLKNCTRSARKKSGPAKGTKYAPRRRKPITEWGERAPVREREPRSYDPTGSALAEGMRSRVPGELSLPPPPGMAVGGDHLMGARMPGRGAGDPWNESTHRAELGPPSMSLLPFSSDRFLSQDAMDRRRLGPPTHHAAEPGTAWAGSSRAGAAAAPFGRAETQGGREGSAMPAGAIGILPPPPASVASDMRPQRMWELPQEPEGRMPLGTGARASAMPRSAELLSPSRREWEPSTGDWAPQPDVPAWPSGSAQAKRLRLSPPRLPPEPGRSLQRPSLEAFASASLRGPTDESPSATFSPMRRLESEQEMLSPTFRPRPREPPDPTAGFQFRPPSHLLSWRRPPQYPPRESRDDFGAQGRGFSPPAEFSDRRSSWSAGAGSGAGQAGHGAHVAGSRRYHEEWQDSAQGSHSADWRPLSSESAAARDPSEMHAAPYDLDQLRRREMTPADAAPAVDPSPGSRGTSLRWPSGGPETEGRRPIYARAGASGPFERQLKRSVGRLPAAAVDETEQGAGGAAMDLWGRDARDRAEGGRQVASREHQDWQGSVPGAGILSTPLMPRRDAGSDAGFGVGASAASPTGRYQYPERPLRPPDSFEAVHRGTAVGSGSTPQSSWGAEGKDGGRSERALQSSVGSSATSMGSNIGAGDPGGSAYRSPAESGALPRRDHASEAMPRAAPMIQGGEADVDRQRWARTRTLEAGESTRPWTPRGTAGGDSRGAGHTREEQGGAEGRQVPARNVATREGAEESSSRSHHGEHSREA